MRFSIIVPVFNVELYLEQCVQSVLDQDYSDFEVILVDDGSTDSSGMLCDALAVRDRRVQVIHQSNSGLSSARNVAMLRATGEILLFLDSDDYVMRNDFLSHIDCIFQSHATKLIEYGAVNFYPPHGPKSGNAPSVVIEYQETSTEEEKEHAFGKLIKRGHLNACAWNKAILRAFALQNGLFFREGVIAEDVDWTARLLCLISNVVIVQTCFIAHRKREGSISSATSLSKMRQMQSNIDYIVGNLPLKRYYLRQYLAIQVANTFIAASRLPHHDYEKIEYKLNDLVPFLAEKTCLRVRIMYYVTMLLGCRVTRRLLRWLR